MAIDARYLDPTLPVEERVESLLSQMTVEEKVGQMMQLDARSDLAESVLNRKVGSLLHCSPTNIVRAQELAKETRLQIPLIIGEDCIHGHSFWPGATIFPTQLGMAATWDRELVYRVGRVTAKEAAATGTHWTFSPVLDIARDLRWGRINETFGEDPYLISELASALVRGYQGEGLEDKTSILATAKHFAGYSQTQGGRDASEADLSHRMLRSWFLPPYERVAKEGCACFMLGYQTTDGVPITVNDWLFNQVLRKEWGYKGTLVTDWDNVGRMVWEQHLQPDYPHAAAAAVKAGNDMIMSTPQFYEGALEALQNGLLTEGDLDPAVRRNLTLKFRLGLFEDPREPDLPLISTTVGCNAHRKVNLRAARQSLVLLHNDGLLPLPITKDPARTLAIVGPLADAAQSQLGDWAGNSGQADWIPEGQPRYMITTVLDGFRALVPREWQVDYVKGCGIVETLPHPEGEFFPDGQPRPHIVKPCAPDLDQIEQAVEAAKNADYTVAVVGDCIELVGEGKSTATLELIGGQIALLDALAKTGTPMIVILMASKPLVLPPSALEAAALVWVANPGMEGGQAIVELILGVIEPIGRLPISFARHVGQLPVFYNQVRGQHGDRYADLTQEPQFVFGEGLSYTEIVYSDAELSGETFTSDQTIEVAVTLSNTGNRGARETVQVYIRDLVTSASWADKELKAFGQVDLLPGETARVILGVPAAECSLVNAEGKRVVEAGNFELLVGPSSRNDDLTALPFEIISEVS